MPDLELTSHCEDMLAERSIPAEWVWLTIRSPDRSVTGADGNVHYIKAIAEYGNRFLRVVVNPHRQPSRVVTVFFDRRLRRKQ